MERFRRFVNLEVNVDHIKNEAQLGKYGIECTYLPDPVEVLDEFEFRTSFNGGEKMVIAFAVEMGKMRRIMLGKADAGNPDVVRSLNEKELEDFLAEKGHHLIDFFELITA